MLSDRFVIKTRELNRILRDTLNSLKFKCVNKSCNSELEYKKAQNHMKNCPERVLGCNNHCGIFLKNKYL